MVYVDNMRAQWRGMEMCHMIADTDEQLHAMAARIGLARSWWQRPPMASGSHYDISQPKRALAIQFGALEITLKQAGAMNARRRVTGDLGQPEEAVEWYRAYRRKKRSETVEMDASI